MFTAAARLRAACVLLLNGAAFGALVEPGPLARLPADTDLALRVRDAAGLRQGPAGRAVVGMLSDLGAFDRAEAAWNALAQELELEPEAAFDALLGEDAVLGMRWAAAGAQDAGRAPPEWVLVSRVSAEAEETIARRLRLAPRSLVAQRHVLALEDGRFELAIDPSPMRAGEAAGARILLAPAHASRLLEQTLANLVHASASVEPTLADVPGVLPVDAGHDRAEPAVFVVARTRPGMPGWLRWPGREGLIVGSCVVDGLTATIEWTMSPSLLASAAKPSLAPGEVAGVEAVRDSIAPQAVAGDRLAGGVVRPGAWARAIVDRPLEDTPLRFAAWLDDVRWDVVLESPEVARGRAWVRFSAGPRVPAPDRP